jgi:hypothetical protein
MKRIPAAAAALALGSALMSPASAAPPTAAPSPGYDARLQQQQRAAQGYYAPVYEPGGRHYVPPHRRVKRVHDHVH